jgi:hypothetical protein
MFGVAPPQGLYHNRAASPAPAPSSSRNSPTTSPQSPPAPASRMPSGGARAYAKLRGMGLRRAHRPGPSESSTALLLAPAEDDTVFAYYRASLASLRDIVDRGDEASLAQLHEYLAAEPADDDDAPDVLAYATALYGPGAEPPASPTTARAERRHSLPVRTSVASLRSQYTLAAAAPDPHAFAQRRRRAAKLAAFFGASYKELLGDVLESIVTGVQDDGGAGRLNDAEIVRAPFCVVWETVLTGAAAGAAERRGDDPASAGRTGLRGTGPLGTRDRASGTLGVVPVFTCVLWLSQRHGITAPLPSLIAAEDGVARHKYQDPVN